MYADFMHGEDDPDPERRRPGRTRCCAPAPPVTRAPHRPLLRRVWELRHSIRPYDAAFVALAERLDVPLVTCDARLAKSNGHTAEVELYPIS